MVDKLMSERLMLRIIGPSIKSRIKRTITISALIVEPIIAPLRRSFVFLIYPITPPIKPIPPATRNVVTVIIITRLNG